MFKTPKRHRVGAFRGRRLLSRPLPSTPHARCDIPLEMSHGSGVRTRREGVETQPCCSGRQTHRIHSSSDSIRRDDDNDHPQASASKVLTPPTMPRPRDLKTSTKKSTKPSKTRLQGFLDCAKSRDHFFNFYSQNFHGMRRSSSNDEGKDSYYKIDQIVNTMH
jgi:hypothetical protein